jgi:Tfp pilus assembly protein PilF
MGRQIWVRAAVAVAALGVGLHAGCMSTGNHTASPTGSAVASNPGTEERQLPASKSAKLCLTVAADLERNGHDAEAAAEYEKARQYDPKLHISRQLGLVYERLGEFRRAQTEYEQALRENPKNAVVLNDLGFLYYSRGKWDDAEKALRDAVAVNPKYARAWINLGLTLGQKDQYAESLEAFRHVVGEGEAQANLAFVLMTRGKRQDAKQAYREALARDPDLTVARAALCKLENPTLPNTAAMQPQDVAVAQRPAVQGAAIPAAYQGDPPIGPVQR